MPEARNARVARTGCLVAAWLGTWLAPGWLLCQTDYQRAEQFLTWNTLRFVTHDQVAPQWYDDSTRFWYRVMTPMGWTFFAVDPATGAKAALFDNARLAAALSLAADSAVDPARLPFQRLEFDRDGRDERVIRVTVNRRGFRCDIVAYQCSPADTLLDRTPYVRSPDQQWEAFVHRHNLFVRPAGGGDSVQLTTDGAELYSYGEPAPRPGQIRQQRRQRPLLSWSPDSRRIAVALFDERRVEKFHLMSSTSQRPQAYSYPYALPGDSTVPLLEARMVDIASRSTITVAESPQSAQSFYTFNMMSGSFFAWGARSDRVYFTHVDRGPTKVRLIAADASTGATRPVLADSAKSFVTGSLDLIGAATNWRVLRNGEVIWFSERDGWGHLYRFGSDGTLRHQITRGPWTVASLLWVDEVAGRIYFTARSREPGRHPDYVHLYSVALDGSGLTLLSPEDAHHVVVAVPSGRYFVDTYSRVDVPPITVLRGPDGRVIGELERADVTNLKAIGWRPGEIFRAKARDGMTDLYGVIWKPADFDSTKRYPVIDHIYPGPLISPVPKSFFPTRDAFSYATFGQVQALAALGFVVVSIDAVGNTARARAQHTLWWGNMGDNGIPDHVAVLKQLGARLRWMDLDRVGIYGHSGGGFASTDALLRYPDFYRVAVSTAGNHDNRSYYYGWGERFQGLLVRDTVRGTDNYENQANKNLVNNLRGRLLLIHGDMDDNVHPATTVQMADALIKANKPFDFLLIPDADHDLTQHPYVIRRTWDYFVEHLLERIPPSEYAITPPPQP
jgi:dipeptidyl aminopeptidase/acylaminoacyl peptidase